MQESRKTVLCDAVGPWRWEFEQTVRSVVKGQGRIQEFLMGGGGGWCQSATKLPGSPSIKIGIDLSIEKSIKIGKSDLIDIDCIDQSIEIDDTLVSFIDSSRFYRFHRFIWEHASVLLFIQKWKLISCKQWIYRQLSCNWESKDQTIITLKKVFFCLADID